MPGISRQSGMPRLEPLQRLCSADPFFGAAINSDQCGADLSPTATRHNSDVDRTQGRLPARLSAWAVFLLLGQAVAPAVAQEPSPPATPQSEALSQGPVSPDSADRIRASLERPPAKGPTDAVDVIEFPFKVVLFPLALVGYGISALLDVAVRPPSSGGLGKVYRDMVEWGLTPAIGGLGERSGTGGALRLNKFNPLFIEAGWTLRGWQLYRGGFFGNWGNTSVEFAGGWYRQNSLLFWGFGPESPDAGRSEYRWDQSFLTMTGNVPFGEKVRLDVGVGFERNDVGVRAGPLEFVPVFGEGVTKFAQANANLVFDFSYMKKFQPRGVRFGIGGAGFVGSEDTPTQFWRFSGLGEGYVPINDRQQLALRALVDMMRGNDAGHIPFMYLSSIGGTYVLRSYNTDRFRDRDRVALTAEWRYEVWRDLHERSRIEGFVFWDEATVARNLDDIEEFRSSVGLGARFIFGFRVRAVTFLAFGAEGARFTFSFTTVQF